MSPSDSITWASAGAENARSTAGHSIKPRGAGAYGFHWNASVTDKDGRAIWRGQVNKSAGCKGILKLALEHDFMVSAFGEGYVDPWRDYWKHFNDPAKQAAWKLIQRCQPGAIYH